MKKIFAGLVVLALAACGGMIKNENGSELLTKLDGEPTGCVYLYKIESEVSVYDSDDENEFFVLVGESDVIGTVELPEELYDAIKDEYEDKFVPLRGSDEYVIDFDWAVNLLGIDQAIYESEKEIEDGAEALDAHEVFSELDEKHFS